MHYDVVVVGGGIAGLTAAAFACKAGQSVLLCEQGHQVGGLVNSFIYKGFVFDGGIRSIENSGVVLPMLKELGIELEFTKNTVSIGFEDDVVEVRNHESLQAYRDMLAKHFPNDVAAVDRIMKDVRQNMKYM
ncbi:MAG: FAD-dependent oxidoreductase, partial [Erysipelotrichaceae bacterium]